MKSICFGFFKGISFQVDAVRRGGRSPGGRRPVRPPGQVRHRRPVRPRLVQLEGQEGGGREVVGFRLPTAGGQSEKKNDCIFLPIMTLLN